MANKDASFGLRPARMMNGSAFMNQQNKYELLLATQLLSFRATLLLP